MKYSYTEKKRIRKNFGNFAKVMDLPNLIETQSNSYAEFLQVNVDPDKRKRQGLEDVFQSLFPITSVSGNAALEYVSYEIGKNILLINSEAVFRRSLTYRIFPIETFFRWKPKIELNFTLAPIWGRARIEMDTTPGDKTDDWNYFITSFGGSANPVSDMGATDAMISDWIGYSSLLGFRYYINTRLGVDVKAGFMNNQYKASEWRIQRQKVTGHELKIDDLPIFSIKVIYGLR